MDHHLARIMVEYLPRLKAAPAYPITDDRLTLESWRAALDEMREGFLLYIQEWEFSPEGTKEEILAQYASRQEKIDRSLELFATYFGHLWI